MLSHFERTDIPAASNVIGAPVARVYETLAAVERWPGWIPCVVSPVQPSAEGEFDVTAVNDGTLTTRRCAITTMGTNHTLFIAVEGVGMVLFRTRPSATGTLVDVCVDLGRRRGPVGHLRSLRTRSRLRRALPDLLLQLQHHVEAGA